MRSCVEILPGAALGRSAAAIRAAEAAFPHAADGGAGETGWGPVDAALGGGLRRGAIHEWFGDEGAGLTVLLHVARQSARRSAEGGAEGGWVAWVGRACWVYAPALGELLERSILVDARTPTERFFAMDACLRSRGLAAVVGDARGMRMSDSRRLQMAARAGGGLGLLARPMGERRELSASWTRWEVRPGMGAGPGWEVSLRRCKSGWAAGVGGAWIVRHDHESGDVSVVSAAGDRPASAA